MDSQTASKKIAQNGSDTGSASDERLELTDKLIMAGPRDYTRIDLADMARSKGNHSVAQVIERY